MNDQKEKIKVTLPHTVELKGIKYLGINQLKETKYLYSENYKILLKEIKDDTNNGKVYHVLRLKESYSKNDYITQSNLHVWCNPYQTTNGIFHRITTKIFYSFFGNNKDYE